MSVDLTPRQTLLVWSLVGTHGQSAQGAIVPKVEKADREALEHRGFLAGSKKGRAIWLELTDAGWAWAGDHLRDEVPPAYQVLRAWLTRLHDHLQKTSETLAAFIGAPPVATELPPPKKPKTASRKPKAALSKKQVRKRIEDAYLTVTGGRKGQGANLSQIRAHLSDLDRAAVDSVFQDIVQGDKKARLIRIDNPRDVSVAEREAAFNPGGQPFHLLWITP